MRRKQICRRCMYDSRNLNSLNDFPRMQPLDAPLVSPIKLVVSGPVGAGKTTMIHQLSDSPVIETEEAATESLGKPTTTVALDFGLMTIEDQPVHLFGTPGQERFDYMWEILCEGAFGLMLLVAGDTPGQFSKARRILEFLTSQVPIPYVIGVTRQDIPRVWDPSDVADFFEVPHSEVTGLNATHRPDCLRALHHLFVRVQSQSEQD